MAESTRKNSNIILMVAVCAGLGIIGYFVWEKWLKGKLGNTGANQTPNPTPSPSPSPSPTPTPNPTPTPTPTPTNDGTVTINAVNNADPWLRDWNIFNKDAANSYIGNGKYSVGNPTQTANLVSGNTWTLKLAKGTYYFLIGSIPDLGTYSGTIVVNGQTVPFAGVNLTKSAQFTVN